MTAFPPMQFPSFLSLVVLLQLSSTATASDICISPTNTFTARINLFAGELGYYVFEECGLDVLNPTIAMEVGETYTFVQEHRSNYFHRKCVVVLHVWMCVQSFQS